jgi:glycosyltransferase involved in cell wall biosynthesis
MDYFVSIIIPNYNHARYISDAIQSVLRQDYGHYEVIVVDDGSTDNSREVVAQFGDRVRYIWQENQGLSAARNTGIRAARGDLIGLLDADDLYETDFLSKLVPILKENPDAEAVYCGYQFVDIENNALPQKEARSIPQDQLYQALVDGNFLVPESILVRRRCYESVGLFDITLRACEDLDMWLRIAGRYKVLGTTQLLTRHRILPNSMSTDPSRQAENRLAAISKHFGQRPKDLSSWDEAKRRAFSQAYLASAVEFLQAHNKEKAYEYFREMIRTSPGALSQLNTFYELGCGDQPKGFRGDFSTLNIESNAAVMIEFLDRVFREPELADTIKPLKKIAYGNAFYALGLLSYGSRELKSARMYFICALRRNQKFFLDRNLLFIFVKSLFGRRILEQFAKNKTQ